MLLGAAVFFQLFFHSFFSVAQAQNKTLILSDFDGIFVEDRAYTLGGKKVIGVFNTPVVLFRSLIRGHAHEDVPVGPEEVEVSWETYQRLKREHRLARDHGKLGAQNLETEDLNGNKFRPGNYLFDGLDSLRYYMEAEKGQNHLLRSFKRAEKEAEKGGGRTWKGRFWGVIELLLSHEETAKNFGIITARGHSTEEWKEFFTYLRKQEYIKFLPNFARIYSLSRTEFDILELDHDMADRKAKLVKTLAMALADEPLDTSDLRLSRRGAGKPLESVHTINLIDDTPGMIEAYWKALRTVVTGQLAPVKIGIFDLGLPEDRYEARRLGISGQAYRTPRPRYSIIGADGQPMEASDIEILGESIDLPKAFRGKQLERFTKSIRNSLLGYGTCGDVWE